MRLKTIKLCWITIITVTLNCFEVFAGVLFPKNGIEISPVPTGVETIIVNSDGNGGLLIVWHENESRKAKRIGGSGNTIWGPVIIPVGGLFGTGGLESVVSDGMGGAFVVHEEYVGDIFNFDAQIVAHRIDNFGNLLWRVIITSAPVLQTEPFSFLRPSVSDLEGGFIVIWNHLHTSNLFAQRINQDGIKQWQVLVSSFDSRMAMLNDGHPPNAVSDSTGGVICSFVDGEGFTRAQRIDRNGNLLWGQAGVQIPGFALAEDGSGGIIAGWSGNGNFLPSSRVVQKVDRNGNLLWGSGVIVDVPVERIVGDKQGGAIIGNGVGEDPAGHHLIWEYFRN